MAKRSKSRPVTAAAMDREHVARMVAHRQSGAAGTHADQRARKDGAVGRTNRQGTRGARTRAALSEFR